MSLEERIRVYHAWDQHANRGGRGGGCNNSQDNHSHASVNTKSTSAISTDQQNDDDNGGNRINDDVSDLTSPMTRNNSASCMLDNVRDHMM